MAEWSKAAVLKTAEVQASVGSNPTPSASQCAARIGQNHHYPQLALSDPIAT